MPRLSVAVDLAVLTIETTKDVSRLSVLEVKATNGWGLPSAPLKGGEALAEAAFRALHDRAGVDAVRPVQFHVYEEPADGTISIAHVDLVAIGLLRDAARRSDVRIVPASAPGRLAGHTAALIAGAVVAIREQYRNAPDPAGLLPHEFSLRDLQEVHETVLGERLKRDTFRRLLGDRLQPTGTLAPPGLGRPAELFRRARPR